MVFILVSFFSSCQNKKLFWGAATAQGKIAPSMYGELSLLHADLGFESLPVDLCYNVSLTTNFPVASLPNKGHYRQK